MSAAPQPEGPATADLKVLEASKKSKPELNVYGEIQKPSNGSILAKKILRQIKFCRSFFSRTHARARNAQFQTSHPRRISTPELHISV